MIVMPSPSLQRDLCRLPRRPRPFRRGTRMPPRRPCLRSRRHAVRSARFDKVQAKLAEQEEKIAAYRKGRQDEKPKPGVVSLYKRLMSMRGGSK